MFYGSIYFDHTMFEKDVESLLPTININTRDLKS